MAEVLFFAAKSHFSIQAIVKFISLKKLVFFIRLFYIIFKQEARVAILIGQRCVLYFSRTLVYPT